MSEKEKKEIVEEEIVENAQKEAAPENKIEDERPCEEDKEELPLKSELVKEQKDLVEQYNTGIEELLNREFKINVVNKSQFDKLYKFVEKGIKVTHATAANIVMLHANLKQQKSVIKFTDDWDGTVMMNLTSCKALWTGFKDWDGNGVFDAASFLNLMQLVGPEVSKVLSEYNKELLPLNGIHTRLSEIDDALDSGRYVDDMPEEEVETPVKDSEERIEEIADEVNPEV